MGLPSTIFFGGVTLTLLFFFMLPWFIGIAFGLVFFTAMYTIHRDDPKALQGWMNAAFMRRKEVWSGGTYKGRKIHIIDDKD